MFFKHWEPATGVVIDARFSGRPNSSNPGSQEFVVEVRTASGEVFRAKVDEPRIAIDFWPPIVNQTVRLEFDPRSRKVRFDKDDPALSRKRRDTAARDSFEDALVQPVGTPVRRAGVPRAYMQAGGPVPTTWVNGVPVGAGAGVPIPDEALAGLPDALAAQLRQVLATGQGASVVHLDLPEDQKAALRANLAQFFGQAAGGQQATQPWQQSPQQWQPPAQP